MSFSERYITNPMGRTALISFLLSLIFAYLSFLLPLAPADNNAWYSFLYSDITLPPEERFNWGLVILESFFFGLFFFFLVVGLGAYAEVQNRLPSWTEFIVAAIITIILSLLLPQISVGEGSVGEISGSGFNHFTTKMQTAVFFFTLLFMILWTLYIYYSAPNQEK